jgi:hypothetical protein
MMEGLPMKLICEYPPGTLRNATTSSSIPGVAMAIRQMPGIGKPFLIFQSLPGTVTIADFGMYPQYVVSADVAENEAMINAMLLAPPTDALTY